MSKYVTIVELAALVEPIIPPIIEPLIPVLVEPLISDRCANNDPRLSDARPPMAHNHDGVYALAGHAHSGMILEGDPRLSDPRAPLAHAHSQSDVTGLATILGSKVDTTDSRLSDPRTPLAHTHAQSEVTGLTTSLSAKEGALGNPSADGQILSSTMAGVRSWTTPPSGGSVDITQVEVDFGSVAVRSKTFTITDALVSPTTQIIATQAGDAPTGKNADDNEMDSILFRALPGTGQFTLYATVIEGIKVNGFYRMNYLRG